MEPFQIILALIFGLYGSQPQVSVMIGGRAMLISGRCYESREFVRSVRSIGEKQFTVRGGYTLPSEPFSGYGCEPKPRDPGEGDRRSESTTWGKIKSMFADRGGSSGTIGNDFNSQSDYGSGSTGGGRSGSGGGGSSGGGNGGSSGGGGGSSGGGGNGGR